jgi:hypothetical protein
LGAATKQRVREGTAEWEDSAFAAVRCGVRELVRDLHLHLVTIYNISINPIINPNPASNDEICWVSSLHMEKLQNIQTNGEYIF